jgi:hypothetical protein
MATVDEILMAAAISDAAWVCNTIASNGECMQYTTRITISDDFSATLDIGVRKDNKWFNIAGSRSNSGFRIWDDRMDRLLSVLIFLQKIERDNYGK